MPLAEVMTSFALSASSFTGLDIPAGNHNSLFTHQTQSLLLGEIDIGEKLLAVKLTSAQGGADRTTLLTLRSA